MRAAPCAIALIFVTSAASAGVIDDRLTAADPCSDLPQINQTESVTLERADITILPETTEWRLAGRIACRSPEDAMIPSDASVRVEAMVTLEVDSCTATAAEVKLNEFGGSVGRLVEALSQVVEQEFAQDVAEAAEAACMDLLNLE